MREAALTLIERRLRTRADIARRLRGRHYPVDIIEQVLDRLAEVGLVNDQAYAEAFLRDRRRFRPRSGRMLRTELRQRGVGDEEIEAAMAALAEDLDERGLAAELLARRAGRWRREDPDARRRRAEALLRRNGFAWEVIREVLAADTHDQGGSSDDGADLAPF